MPRAGVISTLQQSSLLKGDASSCHTLKKMATRVGSDRVWRGCGYIFRPLVGPADFPCEGRTSVRPLHRRAGGLGCRHGLDLRGTTARQESMHFRARGASGRCHRLRSIATFCTAVRDYLCLDRTGHRAIEHPWPYGSFAHRRRVRSMVASSTDWRGSRVGTVPPGFVRLTTPE